MIVPLERRIEEAELLAAAMEFRLKEKNEQIEELNKKVDMYKRLNEELIDKVDWFEAAARSDTQPLPTVRRRTRQIRLQAQG